MSVRSNLSHTNLKAVTAAGSRATVREFDDAHLVQQVKKADVFHSETPSDFERFQPVGMTAVPLKQEEEQAKKSQQKSAGKGDGDWNHDQPSGPSAEALMMYPNASRSHPIAAMVDDRRVRPYNMKEGEGAHYAPDGSEQMTFFNEKGAYLISLDGTSVKDKKEKKTRMVSLRHVTKKMQTHKIEEGKKEEEYKHEGEKINTEVRNTADKIEMRAPGDKVVGVYDKKKKRWFFDVDASGKATLEMLEDKITVTVGGSSIELTSGEIKLKSAKISHN